ncbi:gb [Venturia nashicola]|nr:gb [Venturia nashicola]
MGLPVWRPSSPDAQKNAVSRDPTASSRSAIRRRRSIEVASTSASNAFPTSRAQVGDYLNRRRRAQERQEVLSGLIASSRRRQYALERLADADVTDTQLTRLEDSELRVEEAYHRQYDAGSSWAGHPRTAESRPRGSPPSIQQRRTMNQVHYPSRDLPSPSHPTRTGMLEQTRELRDQIQRLRGMLQRHREEDARARARAAPWLEPDRQLHSNDPSSPLSALHENRSQLSALQSLLEEVECEFRDPTPHDVEEQFRLSVRARYADNPTENPVHEAPLGNWNEENISEFWDAELARRLEATETTPIGVVAHQVAARQAHTDVEGHRRDSLSPSSSEESETSGGPVSASLSSPPRRSDLESVYIPRATGTREPSRVRRRFLANNTRFPRPPGASLGRAVGLYQRRGEAPWFTNHRVVQSPPSYISAGGIDGLGDRELSVGPGDAEEEAWEVMQTTVAPDHTLPSADSSFTSAAASASFSASRSQSAQSSVPTSFRSEDECPPGVDMFASD